MEDPMALDDTTDALADYDLLGVSPDDDFSAIRAAWIRLVKTWHPDVWHGTESEAVQRMLQVNDAYDRLSKRHNRTREVRRKAREAKTVRTGWTLVQGGVRADVAGPPASRVAARVLDARVVPGQRSEAEADFLEARRAMSRLPETQVVVVA